MVLINVCEGFKEGSNVCREPPKTEENSDNPALLVEEETQTQPMKMTKSFV
jgi:hypothetical protein